MALHVFPPALIEDHALRALRQRVRKFLDGERATQGFEPRVDSWMTGWDQDFTLKLARQGWLGMTIPQQYGGQGKSYLERFVVTEELLASGAPVAAHWLADRQVAPALLNYGSEEQKQEFLPRITQGTVLFAIGMSEPDSGSDLASVRTSARRHGDGWRLNGTKIWTSHAHRADFAVVLARTSPRDDTNRHSGLSQFIVDLRSDGVTIRPIISIDGNHHFNEVHFDGVLVPLNRVLGDIGNGWQQVTAELGYERSGPERFLSTQLVLEDLVRAARAGEFVATSDLGRLFARIVGLHQMSAAVASALSRHEQVNVAACIVKALGTATEGDVAEYAALHIDEHNHSTTATNLRRSVESALLSRPTYTLRGGTNEVLRGIIARELGLR